MRANTSNQSIGLEFKGFAIPSGQVENLPKVKTSLVVLPRLAPVPALQSKVYLLRRALENGWRHVTPLMGHVHRSSVARSLRQMQSQPAVLCWIRSAHRCSRLRGCLGIALRDGWDVRGRAEAGSIDPFCNAHFLKKGRAHVRVIGLTGIHGASRVIDFAMTAASSRSPVTASAG